MQYVKDQPIESLACTQAAMEADGLVTIRLSPPGLVKSKAGSYLLDAEAARACIQAFDEHGVDRPIDWEHQSLAGKYAAPDGRAPAAGWIKSLHFDPIKGLQAQVKLNPKAREAIRGGEYRFLSPVFHVRQSDGRAVELHSAALTNLPAIPHMDALAASTRVDDNTVAHDEKPANVAVPIDLMRKLRDALGLGKEAKAADILQAAIDKLAGKGDDDEGESTDAEGESTDAEVAAAVRSRFGLADDAGKDEVTLAMAVQTDESVLAMRRELDELKNRDADRQADDMLQPHIARGAVNPRNTAVMATYRDMARDEPDKLQIILKTIPDWSVLPRPGRTTAPPRTAVDRHRTIANAAREYESDAGHRKLTSLRAFIDLRLRESGQALLTDAEAAEHAADTLVT